LGLALDELGDKSDHVVETSGLKIVTDRMVKGYITDLKNLTINYIESWRGSGFVVEGLSSC
jgi:Fe-S cluster assembly iron-binding protein IscA